MLFDNHASHGAIVNWIDGLGVCGALVAVVRRHLKLTHLALGLLTQRDGADVGRSSRRILRIRLLWLWVVLRRCVHLLQLLLQHLMRIRSQTVQVVYTADALEVTELVILLVLVVRRLTHNTLVEVIVRQLQQYTLIVLSGLQATAVLVVVLTVKRHLSCLIRVALLLAVRPSLILSASLSEAGCSHLTTSVEAKSYEALIFSG